MSRKMVTIDGNQACTHVAYAVSESSPSIRSPHLPPWLLSQTPKRRASGKYLELSSGSDRCSLRPGLQVPCMAL